MVKGVALTAYPQNLRLLPLNFKTAGGWHNHLYITP